MALTTLDAVKTQAGIPLDDTSRDAQLASIILGVTAHVKNSMNRDIEQATYTEFYNGDNTSILILRQRPVISIASIYLDDAGYWGQGPTAFGASTLLVAGVDYAIRQSSTSLGSTTGMVYRIGGIWRSPSRRDAGFIANQPGVGIGNIKVTYVAGFAVIPYDIQMAVNSLVMRIANAAATGGNIAQGAYEDASVVYMAPKDAAQMMGSIEMALAPSADVAV